ncbi:MAG: recombinase zinc beta ribbon domain-containing protein [Thermoflexaceae bacterium]|nr:recombinase zinc beta ribbon domain-containing protein [Thermoflexaceae bacterium]
MSGRIREEDRGFYKDDHVHLLKGLIKCGVCGTTMTPYPAGKKDKAGNPYLYYSCTSVTQDGSALCVPSVAFQRASSSRSSRTSFPTSGGTGLSCRRVRMLRIARPSRQSTSCGPSSAGAMRSLRG